MKNPQFIVNRFKKIVIFRQRKVLNKFSFSISSYKTNIKPLKDVKDEQNPVNKISFLD